jgi:hypothetical protein
VIRALAAMVAAVACVTTSVARADGSGDAQRADALFEEGKELRGQGRYAVACADFEESRRLDEGIGVTLYLADCYEQAGDLPRALGEYRRAEALAVARGDKRGAVARRRAEALEPRVFSKSPVQGDARPVADSSTPPAGVTPLSSVDAIQQARATRRWIGAGFVGTGVIGIGVGATFGVIALSKLSRSNDGPCTPDDHCSPTGLALRHQSADAATASTIGFAAGAAFLAAGIAISLSAPRDGEKVALTPMLSADGAGALLQGRF